MIIGSYDMRFSWFDLDLSSTPYKTLRYHQKAIRSVQFHKQYPLLSTCSDDGTVHIIHATVYNDFIHNALIVPLKVLRGHEVKNELGVLDTDFHPTQVRMDDLTVICSLGLLLLVQIILYVSLLIFLKILICLLCISII